MSEQNNFLIIYREEELNCFVTLIRSTYSYQLKVECNNHTMFFEPDEDSNFRMVRMPWHDATELEKLDKEFVRIILETLQDALLK